MQAGAPRIGIVDSGGPAGAMAGARAFRPDGEAEAPAADATSDE